MENKLGIKPGSTVYYICRDKVCSDVVMKIIFEHNHINVTLRDAQIKVLEEIFPTRKEAVQTLLERFNKEIDIYTRKIILLREELKNEETV